MAKNNETQVVDNIVQPRFYQVYGDLIESKEVMEPLSIISGTGPICGFDWVDTTKTDVTITSIFKADLTSLISGADRVLRNRSKRVFLSNKENKAGQVFNAYTTPDGLCHIAPDILTFNGVQPDGGWPSTSNPQKLVAFVVKASHTYKADGSENPPSVSNFTCNWLDIGTNTLNLILTWDYDRMITLLSDSGISFNKDIESIIGIYLIGWDPSWDSDSNSLRYKSIISTFKYQLCLIPYQGKFTSAPYGLNPMDIMSLKNRVKLLEDDTIPIVNRIYKLVDNLQNSLGSNVEVVVNRVGTDGDNDVYSFSKLNINGSNFIKTNQVRKQISYQWYEGADALGIFVPQSLDLTTTPEVEENDWDIGTVSFTLNDQGQFIYDSINPPYTHSNWKLVGCIMPQLVAGDINDSLIVQSGFQSTNPDSALAWRLGICIKKLLLQKTNIEVADSGALFFNPTNQPNDDHYAYIKAFMGVNTLTIRVVVNLYSRGTGVSSLNYDLSTLFDKNPLMSNMVKEVLKLRDTNDRGVTRIFLSMPTTFKASDINPEAYPSSLVDFEFQKYSVYLDIATNVAKLVIRLGGLTPPTGTGVFDNKDYLSIGHEITIPISDRTQKMYADILK